MQYFDPVDQFKLSIKGIKILNFIEYPFLLNIDYKNVTPISNPETPVNWDTSWTPSQYAERPTSHDERNYALALKRQSSCN